jgi:hypothetical protein
MEPFSFDECLGLTVDTIQAYGHELSRLRRQNEVFKEMIHALE